MAHRQSALHPSAVRSGVSVCLQIPWIRWELFDETVVDQFPTVWGGFGGLVSAGVEDGDQLIVDLDLSEDNLPAWTRLQIGSAVIEVTDQPHRGCGKFIQRFGLDAHRFVNSETGMQLKLRGVNARVVTLGVIRQGDTITKIA